jgi:dihydropyrimidinase
MPGGIDPHTHLEMPFMGTYSADDFESGTRAALSGGTTMVVDFILPGQGQGLMDAACRCGTTSRAARPATIPITWRSPGGVQSVWDDMEASVKAGITSFKHFMAYKGALMVNDDELFASFSRVGDLGGLAMVHAENGDVVAELQPS